jgi:hypothetical protein
MLQNLVPVLAKYVPMGLIPQFQLQTYADPAILENICPVLAVDFQPLVYPVPPAHSIHLWQQQTAEFAQWEPLLLQCTLQYAPIAIQDTIQTQQALQIARDVWGILLIRIQEPPLAKTVR